MPKYADDVATPRDAYRTPDAIDKASARETRYGQNELGLALGRGNYLFFGNEEAGHDFAVLDTLVASCEKHGINLMECLTDVLMRVQTHAASENDEFAAAPLEAT